MKIIQNIISNIIGYLIPIVIVGFIILIGALSSKGFEVYAEYTKQREETQRHEKWIRSMRESVLK